MFVTNDNLFIIKIFFIFVYVLSVTAITGIQKYPLNHELAIKGSVSGTEFNRIKIEGDRIIEVIGLNENWAVENEEKLGQIFIKTLREHEGQGTFTVVTEKGKTQDFILKVEPEKEGQVIIVENDDINLDSKVIGNKHVRHDEGITLIKSIRKEKYQEIGAPQIKDNLEISLLNEKKSANYSIEIWSILSKRKEKILLEEKYFAFNNPEVIGVMFEQRDLNQGESKRLYKVNYHE